MSTENSNIVDIDKSNPNHREVMFFIKKVKIDNKDIKNCTVAISEGGNKNTKISIPFNDYYKIHFNCCEEKITVKLLFLIEDEILGYVYLEIPEKFKNNKKVKLNDWYKIIQIPKRKIKLTEDNMMTNIELIYKSTEKTTKSIKTPIILKY